MMRRRGLLQAVLARLRGQLLRKLRLRLRRDFARERRHNGGLHFAQRLRMRALALFNLNNVVAKAALHNGDVADFLRKDSLVELRNHLAALRESQLAALVLAARVIGIFLRQCSPASTGLQLLQNALRLRLGRGIGLGVRAFRHADENVP